MEKKHKHVEYIKNLSIYIHCLHIYIYMYIHIYITHIYIYISIDIISENAYNFMDFFNTSHLVRHNPGPGTSALWTSLLCCASLKSGTAWRDFFDFFGFETEKHVEWIFEMETIGQT